MELIVSLTPTSSDDPLRALARPPRAAALVELRGDLLPHLDPAQAIAACPLPVLYTLRSRCEGGQGPDDPETRSRTLTAAYEAGVAMLDLELERDAPLLGSLGIDPERVVVSWHQAGGPRRDLTELCRQLAACPARWLKVVPDAANLTELEEVIALHRVFNPGKPASRRLLAFATGNVGIASRYLSPLLGPPLSYVAWSENAPAAPGQLTAAQMDAVVGHLCGPPQRIFGVIGGDVSSSLSPAMHGAGYRALGLRHVFLPISVPTVEELDQLFVHQGQGMFGRLGLEIGGLAVTAPYKRQAATAATISGPRVCAARAANTLVFKGQQIMADNTDADGVVGSLHGLGLDPEGRGAIVQGTGGAARGAALGLRLAGAEVWLRGRSAAHTRSVAEELGVAWCAPDQGPQSAQILVNATPLGSSLDDSLPFTTDELSRATAVVDMVYGGHVTPLTRIAREQRVAVADGREVLAQQGYAQFAAFTASPPPREAMRRALGLPTDADPTD